MLLRCLAAGLAALSGLGSAVSVTAYATMPDPAGGLAGTAVVLAVGCFIAAATWGLMTYLQDIAERMARIEHLIIPYGDARATDALLEERGGVYRYPRAVGESSGDVVTRLRDRSR